MEPDRQTLLAHLKANPRRHDPNWKAAEPTVQNVLQNYPDPMRALCEAAVPALILRQAFAPANCQALVERLISRKLMPDPLDTANPVQTRTRIDIGTSLGYRGDDQEAFLQHASGTFELFNSIFDGMQDPVAVMYESLRALAPGKTVMVAHEPDGRRYGPAIFRVHYDDHAYAPHFDSVRLREKRLNYAVSRFQHQFAGVLCLQNDATDGSSTQSIMHRCLWSPEVQPAIAEGSFHAYAAQRDIGCCRVELNPGDLYFFNTRCIHEVPALQGNSARIVLAVFIGYSPEDGEIFVWS